MKKLIVCLWCCSMLFTAFTAHAQQRHHSVFIEQRQTIPVARLKALTVGESAVLTGNIITSVGENRFLFRDSSGEVIVEIKPERWNGFSVSPNDRVEIEGEIMRERTGLRTEVYVRNIRRR